MTEPPETVPPGTPPAGTPPVNPGEAAEAAVAGVLGDLALLPEQGQRAVVVDSPPGAGKTTLVVAAAIALVEGGERCMIVAQTNHQVDDLAIRLAAEAPKLRLGRLARDDYVPPVALAGQTNVTVAQRAADLLDQDVVLATAAKWATVREHRWRWAIVDEAYQMRSDALLLVADRFDRALFVGDPGQLDPFSTVESERWTGLSFDPLQSAVDVLLAHNPDVPVHRLPVSWRLPSTAAPVVSEAFYPFAGFRAGTGPGVRRLGYGADARGDAVDETLDVAARAGWALYELPARHTPRTDAGAAAAVAAIGARLLARQAVGVCERRPGGAPVGADRIAVGVAHRDQAERIRQALAAAHPDGAAVAVDTANRLQGREFDVTIVLHPLSGRYDATAFHLEAGRLCVLTSRHRQACVVVARAGITGLLDAYPSTEPVRLGTRAVFADGWEANHAVLAHLHEHRVEGG